MSVPKWMYEKPIAHRGYFDDESPENSLRAFKKAIENNYAIEMDVRILKDDTLIVFHDDNFKRMTGVDLSLNEANKEDLVNLKLLNTEEPVPTFQEFLELIDGQIPLMIEFKNDTFDNKTESLAYELLKNYHGEYVIQSFNPMSIYWFKKHAPHIVRGQLSFDYKNQKMSFVKRWFLKNVYGNILTKPHYVIYDIHALESKVISKLRKKQMPLFSYTAKSLKDYHYALSLNIPACFEGFSPE